MIMVNAKSLFHRRHGELCSIFVIILTKRVKHFTIINHGYMHYTRSFKTLRGYVGKFYYHIDTIIEETEAQSSS